MVLYTSKQHQVIAWQPERVNFGKQFEQRNNTKNMIKGHNRKRTIAGVRKICVKRGGNIKN